MRSALFMAAVVMVGCSSASAPVVDDDVLAENEELPPDDDRIDEAVPAATANVSSSSLEVAAPNVGESVRAVIELEDGTWQSLNVTNDEATGVQIQREEAAEEEVEAEEAVVAAAASAGSPSACKDSAFSRMGHKWKKPFEWRFRSGTTPSTNAKSKVEQSLKEAAANVARSHNDCGLTKAAAPSQIYRGRTRKKTNIVSNTTSIRCGARDGFSVVGFGVLPKGVVGLACTWSIGNEAIESDIKLNDHHYSWFARNSVPAGCRSSFSVEGVSTHEFGHTFGLGHVSESRHKNLTMSTQTRACTIRDASLGKGDVLGLRKLYGL